MPRLVVICLLATTGLLLGPALPAAVKVMFVTSQSGTADLSSWPDAGGKSGRAAGDHVCQTLASDAGLANPADFRAWLSNSTTDAFCHVAGFSGKIADNCGKASLPNAGPWQRIDGKPFSHRLQALVANKTILYVPDLDETGTTEALGLVYTGTLSDGSAAGRDCDGWTSASTSEPPNAEIGQPSFGTAGWTSTGNTTCGLTGRLYCFESGIGDNLPSYANPGAYVFVTAAEGTGDLGSWPLADGETGASAGDAICRNSAAAAGLPAPQSFFAWLSAGLVAAGANVNTDGPFRRIGGVEIAESKETLLGTADGGFLESDIETQEDGVHTRDFVYTGTGPDGEPTGNDCAGWTSSDPGDYATVGTANTASWAWTGWSSSSGSFGCDNTFHLYCISNVVTIFANGFESGNLNAWSATAP